MGNRGAQGKFRGAVALRAGFGITWLEVPRSLFFPFEVNEIMLTMCFKNRAFK